MSSSLFGLISLVGSASLGELRARGSVDTQTLAREIVEMVRRGTIQLSANPDFTIPDTNPALKSVIDDANLIKNATGTQVTQMGALVAKLESAMDNEETAQSIIVDPTPKGFRMSF